MMSSEPLRERAAETVGRILTLLDEREMAERIDRPVDLAVERFSFRWTSAWRPDRLHRVIGALLTQLWTTGGAYRSLLRPGRLKDQAVSLLDATYQGLHDRGYDGAMLDVRQSPEMGRDGIDSVLLNLADAIKGRLRDHYTAWVYAICIDPCDTALRRAMVEHVMETHGHLMPGDLLGMRPFELVDEIPHLIDCIRGNERALRPLQADVLG